jgi:hypothetical protein
LSTVQKNGRQRVYFFFDSVHGISLLKRGYVYEKVFKWGINSRLSIWYWLANNDANRLKRTNLLLDDFWYVSRVTVRMSLDL